MTMGTYTLFQVNYLTKVYVPTVITDPSVKDILYEALVLIKGRNYIND